MNEFVFDKMLRHFIYSLTMNNVKPEYFTIDIKTKNEDAFFRLYSLLKRINTNISDYTVIDHTNKIQCTFLGICVRVILMKPRVKDRKVALYGNLRA